VKIRFSLRTFLIFIAMLAGALYWRVRPAIVAKQFALAIGKRDYTRADKWVRRHPNEDQSWPHFEPFTSWLDDSETLEMKVGWQNPDWRDWVVGRRRGSCVVVSTSNGMVYGSQLPLIATATSIDVGNVNGAGGLQYQISDKLDDWVEYFQK
jgi:hypothetical protein